jgi:hypothetical protein
VAVFEKANAKENCLRTVSKAHAQDLGTTGPSTTVTFDTTFLKLSLGDTQSHYVAHCNTVTKFDRFVAFSNSIFLKNLINCLSEFC